jgi:hypothetical protein
MARESVELRVAKAFACTVRLIFPVATKAQQASDYWQGMDAVIRQGWRLRARALLRLLADYGLTVTERKG